MKQLLTILALFVTAHAFAQQNLAWAYITKVYDGDGARLVFLKEKPAALPNSTKKKDRPKGPVVKVRFVGVDAPEIKNDFVGITETQPWALQSRDSLRKLIRYKYVLVDTLPYGRKSYSYDRLLVDVYVPEQSPGLLNYYIVSKGWAWAKPSPRKDQSLDKLILNACEEAQTSHVGMFSQKVKGRWFKNVTPAYWRSTHKKKQ